MHFAKPYFAAPQPSKLQPGTSGFTTASGVSGVTSISASDTGIPDLRDEQAPTAKPGKIKRSAQLDLLTIRVSILIEMSLYLVMASDLSPTAFVITTVLITLGSASSPNANSLALSLLPNSREAGKLFGALSVLHALGATLISPLLFGTLFAYTVGWYAPTVFALASGFLFLAQVGFAFVRLPKDAGVQGKAERGRSRNVKRVKSSAPVNN
jgi:MFS family permease